MNNCQGMIDLGGIPLQPPSPPLSTSNHSSSSTPFSQSESQTHSWALPHSSTCSKPHDSNRSLPIELPPQLPEVPKNWNPSPGDFHCSVQASQQHRATPANSSKAKRRWSNIFAPGEARADSPDSLGFSFARLCSPQSFEAPPRFRNGLAPGPRSIIVTSALRPDSPQLQHPPSTRPTRLASPQATDFGDDHRRSSLRDSLSTRQLFSRKQKRSSFIRTGLMSIIGALTSKQPVSKAHGSRPRPLSADVDGSACWSTRARFTSQAGIWTAHPSEGSYEGLRIPQANRAGGSCNNEKGRRQQSSNQSQFGRPVETEEVGLSDPSTRIWAEPMVGPSRVLATQLVGAADREVALDDGTGLASPAGELDCRVPSGSRVSPLEWRCGNPTSRRPNRVLGEESEPMDPSIVRINPARCSPTPSGTPCSSTLQPTHSHQLGRLTAADTSSTIMPILSHARVPSFPFRRRRASSTSSPRSSPDPTTPSPTATLTPIPAIANSLLPPQAKNLTSSSQQSIPSFNSSQPNSTLHPPPRPSRRTSTHFERFQAKMTTVRIRSPTLHPTGRSLYSGRSPDSCLDSYNSSSLPHALQITLPWQSANKSSSAVDHLVCSPSQPLTQPGLSSSSVPSNRTSDSSHLTLTSQPSPSAFPKSSLCGSDLPPQLDLAFSPNPTSLLPGLNHPFDDFSSSSSLPHPGLLDPCHKLTTPRPFQKNDANNHHDNPEDALGVQLSCTLSQTDRSIDQPAAHTFTQVAAESCIAPSPTDNLPLSSCRPSGLSSLSSRVRPTPSPGNSDPTTPGSSSPGRHPVRPSPPSRRPPPLPARLCALPRLDSYTVTNAHPGATRQPSNSSQSSGTLESGGEDAGVIGHESDENGDISDEEPDLDDGPGDQTVTATRHMAHSAAESNSTQPPRAPSRQLNWVSREASTPSKSCLTQPGRPPVPARIITSSQPIETPRRNPAPSYFDLPACAPTTASIQSPGDRARLLLLSPSTSSMIQSPVIRRPSIGTRRSQSVLDFYKLAATSSVGSQPVSPVRIPSTRQPVLSSIQDSPEDLRAAILPEEPVGELLVDGDPQPTVAAHLLIAPPPPSSRSLFSQRRQSMFEMRPSNTEPPPYHDALEGIRGTKHLIIPREEEGREGLPDYSCAIHLEGWMPRKMEFRSPGIQAKDRAWKRQYVVLHGTMIRIYRFDPHTHPVTGTDDPYTFHYVQSSSSHLALTCGQQSLSESTGHVTPSLHFHQGQYDSAPLTSLKEVAFAKASQLPTHHNSLQRVYTLQNAESGLAADYVKRKYIVRVRAEGEQFLLQAKDDRGVIDLIEALQAATNVSLDLDVRPLPKFITLPRRRRRRRTPASLGSSGRVSGVGGREIGAAVVEGMVAEAEATDRARRRDRRGDGAWDGDTGDRMADMLAEEQEAYMRSRS